jgi:UDP-N-acetylglucosamine enolpyruvyl transferase
MMTAVANADGTRIVLLGLTRENVRRLTAGQPIRVAAVSHPGFPTDLKILITFAETDRELGEAIREVCDDQTQIVTVPRTPPREQ